VGFLAEEKNDMMFVFGFSGSVVDFLSLPDLAFLVDDDEEEDDLAVESPEGRFLPDEDEDEEDDEDEDDEEDEELLSAEPTFASMGAAGGAIEGTAAGESAKMDDKRPAMAAGLRGATLSPSALGLDAAGGGSTLGSTAAAAEQDEEIGEEAMAARTSRGALTGDAASGGRPT